MNELQDPRTLLAVLQSIGTGICLLGKDMRVLFWNTAAERITGYMSQEVLGHLCKENVLSRCTKKTCESCEELCPFAAPFLDPSPRTGQIQLRHKQGHQIPVQMQVSPIRGDRGIIALVATFDEQKLAISIDRRQYSLAAYGCLDLVTGIPNHGFTNFHLNENLASFNQYQLPFGVVFIEIDQLDKFRLRYGKAAGDAILRIVAQTVAHALRPNDFLGRWEENQLLVLMLHCDRQHLQSASERVNKAASCAGLRWWGDELVITTSTGYASAEAGDTAESLLARAKRVLKQKAAAHTIVAAQPRLSTGRLSSTKP